MENGVINMFKKEDTKKKQVLDETIETIIGKKTFFSGNISSQSAIRVEGKIEGMVKKASLFFLGVGGCVIGDIFVIQATISGKVIGNIHCSKHLEILETAQIKGDIKSKTISIKEGATFDGKCSMMKDDKVIKMDLEDTDMQIKEHSQMN